MKFKTVDHFFGDACRNAFDHLRYIGQFRKTEWQKPHFDLNGKGLIIAATFNLIWVCLFVSLGFHPFNTPNMSLMVFNVPWLTWSVIQSVNRFTSFPFWLAFSGTPIEIPYVSSSERGWDNFKSLQSYEWVTNNCKPGSYFCHMIFNGSSSAEKRHQYSGAFCLPVSATYISMYDKTGLVFVFRNPRDAMMFKLIHC